MILDINLPEIDGMQVCKALRQSSEVPIIMLTARGGEHDRIGGLESGADDYVAKPFSPRELLARIHVLLRRNYYQDTLDQAKDILKLKDICIYKDS